MVDITLSNKQMKPAVVHTDQFENGVHVLRFVLDNYMQNFIDLRNYRAYAVTSLNGVVDITEIPYTVDGQKLLLTWSLSSYTLRNPGVIQYQIRFSESAEDGTGVWWSYKGNIINRVSINADDAVSANYPTLLKQNQDLIQTLSGAFGSEIIYMPVGESIPVEERLIGRLYYQWLETPTTRATCATGTVNLGERPYADSGLYINNVHVYVDDTSDSAFCIEPELWVDAINAANCGVTATDISTSDNVILLISAKNPGTAGNNIGLKLDVAAYGKGTGQVNPSGGRVSGSTLVGGADAVQGVLNPTGRFEDDNGNILGFIRDDGKFEVIGGASSIIDVNLDVAKVLVSDGEGKVSASTISTTELNYLSGVKSNIQSQLNYKAASSHTHTEYVPIKNANLTGSPTAPTPSTTSNGKQIATTAFVNNFFNENVGEKFDNIDEELTDLSNAINSLNGETYLPNYEAGSDLTTGDNSITANGLLVVCLPGRNNGACSINGVEICGGAWDYKYTEPSWLSLPVGAGDIVTLTGTVSAKFFPYK